MLTSIHAKSLNAAFRILLEESKQWMPMPRRETIRYDSPGAVCVEISNPKARVLTALKRGSNIVATCAEMLWVLAGRNDTKWLELYLPRAKEFSDDGMTWRAGYGKRIRHYGEDESYSGVDQLELVVDELIREEGSARAVITIHDPEEDRFAYTKKDFPCTQSLHFIKRHNGLCHSGFIRSNDLLWGWSGINVFEFAVLQEIVSVLTGIELSHFEFISSSLHYYDYSMDRFKKMREAPFFDIYDYVPVSYQTNKITLTDLYLGIEEFFTAEEHLRNGNLFGYSDPGMFTPTINFVDDMKYVVCAFLCYRRGEHDHLKTLVNRIQDHALKIAFVEYLHRNHRDFDWIPELEGLPSSSKEPIRKFITGQITQ